MSSFNKNSFIDNINWVQLRKLHKVHMEYSLRKHMKVRILFLNLTKSKGSKLKCSNFSLTFRNENEYKF